MIGSRGLSRESGRAHVLFNARLLFGRAPQPAKLSPAPRVIRTPRVSLETEPALDRLAPQFRVDPKEASIPMPR